MFLRSCQRLATPSFKIGTNEIARFGPRSLESSTHDFRRMKALVAPGVAQLNLKFIIRNHQFHETGYNRTMYFLNRALHPFYGRALWAMTLIITASWVTCGQSAVFTIPSTDIQEEKTIYLEADLFAHFDTYPNGGFQSYGPTVVYGARKNLEIGANLFFLRDESGTSAEFQPNVKWKPFKDNNGVAFTVGAIAFVPLDEVSGTKTSVQVYANLSKAIESLRGMRVTGGVYQMIRPDADFGAKTGAIVGLEQPITKRATLLFDWYSGRNRFGYASVALGVDVTETQNFGVGYSFGNSGRGNNYFTAYYGLTF